VSGAPKPVPTAQAPVFIGGPHRSGTGLLRAVIGSNSQLAIPPKEYQFFELLAQRAPLAALDPSQLLRQILTQPKIRQWGLTDAEVLAFAPAGAASLRQIYSAPLLAYAARLGKPRIGDKTPYLERNFTALLDWFGTSLRFVQIIRDPLDTFRSMCHYHEFRRHPGPVDFSRQWRMTLLAGLHYERVYPDNYLLLKYEDFVSDPAHWTEAICDFANLPVELDRMLAMADFQRKQNSSFPLPPRLTPRQHQVVQPIETDRPPLSSRTAWLVEQEVFPDAAEIGYHARFR
jgi:Sulfotransferase family